MFPNGDSNWKDKLTEYNGETITYDAMGNPLSYRDGMSFTWQNGRILKQIKTANDTVVMKYNANGLRTQKDNSDYTTDYYYDSKNNMIGLSANGGIFYFYYDSNNNVTSFSYNNGKYFYVKNLQGDVVKIVDQAGNTVVTYTYDAWGNILKQTDTSHYNLAKLNPFKYRSYVYDYDTGLYYLQSRYYDPVTGKFLNADDMQYLKSTIKILYSNLYTYCCNNSVNLLDYNGNTPYEFIPAPSLDFMFDKKELLYLTRKMYLYSFCCGYYPFGRNYDFSGKDATDFSKQLMHQIQSSDLFQEKVNISLIGMVHEGFVSKCIKTTVNFKYSNNMDLKLSVGNCSVELKIRFIPYHFYKDSYLFHIFATVSDTYDFHCLTYKDANFLTAFINNQFGYLPQQNRLLIPYTWSLDFDFYRLILKSDVWG